MTTVATGDAARMVANRPIYLDHHATTPVDPRVLETMTPYFTEHFGNAASRTHAFGWSADEAVTVARKQVAALIGAKGREIVFTSGATEANNLAIRGAALAARDRGNHIVTVATEHSSVLDTCRHLEREGFRVTRLPVRCDGLIELDALTAAMTDRTVLVSVMLANNEIGVIQPLSAIAPIARARGALFHTDATQGPATIRLDVEEVQIDLASMSGHKIYGPKGVGALFVRRRGTPVSLSPLIHGGGHEDGLRAGTLNVPGIVGFGCAAEICRRERETEGPRLAALRNRLWSGLQDRLGPSGLRVNGSMERRLPNNLSVSFEGVEGEALVMGLSDIAVSFGSACSSGSHAPSHVLQSLGPTEQMAQATLRFGLGRFTTEAEIDQAIDRVSHVVRRLREMSPVSGTRHRPAATGG